LNIPAFLLLTVLKRNFLMHEASHGLAASILGSTSDLLPVAFGQGEATVIRALLSEAFANTVEKLSSAEATGGEHSLCFALNSYIPYEANEVRKLAALANQIGFRAAFVFSFYLYFFSNIFSKQLTINELETISRHGCFGLIPDASEGPEIFKLLLSLRCSVNPRFRHETNVMYFDLCSCSKAFESLVDSPSLLDADLLRRVRNCAEIFCNIAEHGTGGVESVDPVSAANVGMC
jgi:hypothetical protein